MGSGQSTGSNLITPADGTASGPVTENTVLAIKSISDSEISPTQFQAFIDAMNAQLPAFCTTWGFPQCNVVLATGYVPGCFGYINLVNTDPIQGALGYHTEDTNGNPVAIVIYSAHQQDNSYLGYTGDFSGVNPSNPNQAHAFLSTTFSHEVFEMIADPNLEQQGPQGQTVEYTDHTGNTAPIVREVCDPVADQEFTTTVTEGTVYVSDYVYPSWFLTNGTAPFDFMHKCTVPLKVFDDNDYVSDLNDGNTRYDIEKTPSQPGTGSPENKIKIMPSREGLEVKTNNLNSTFGGRTGLSLTPFTPSGRITSNSSQPGSVIINGGVTIGNPNAVTTGNTGNISPPSGQTFVHITSPNLSSKSSSSSSTGSAKSLSSSWEEIKE